MLAYRDHLCNGSKQVYKITYPNGQIYIGSDLTGSVTYFGSPSAKDRIAADRGEHVNDFTARKTILWESETATKAEVLAMEIKLIRRITTGAPRISVNRTNRTVDRTAYSHAARRSDSGLERFRLPKTR